MTSSPLRRYLYISAFRLDELVGQIIRTDGPVTGRSLQLLGVASSYQKANPDERAMFHRNIAAVEDYLTATGQRGMSTPRRSTFRGGCRCSCPFEGVRPPVRAVCVADERAGAARDASALADARS